MSKAVGIDLGTTNSVVAFLEAGEPTVIPNAEGGRTTPSIVGFAKSGEVLVGEVAKRQAITNPDRTVRSVKRQMGTSWTIDIDGKAYTAQEISARILQKLKRDAEAFLGDTVNQAVITVPAYFDDAQRTATKEAGQIAGLEVLRIINEPTAAALAYGLDKEGADQTVLVFDLGGGTFDVSVLEIGEGVFEVKATSGNTHLGGDDWDQRVIDWLVKTFKDTEGVDLSNDKMALQRLKEAAEKAKIELSAVQETTINLPFITATNEGPKHLDLKLTRAKFQELTADLVEACKGPFEQAIKDAGLTASDIDHVVLVGGSTRMPAIYDLVVQLGRQGAPQGRQPGRGRRRRRRHPGRRAEGRGEGHPACSTSPRSASASRPRAASPTASSSATRRSRPSARRSSRPPRTTSRRSRSTCCRASGTWPCTTRRSASSSSSTCRRRPAACPQIEVAFDIDANGIVHVSAKDLATGKGAVDHHHRSDVAPEGRHRAHGPRRRAARGGGPPAQGRGRDPQQRRRPRLPDREAPEGPGRQGPRRRARAGRGRAEEPARVARGHRRRAGSAATPRRSAPPRRRFGQRLYEQAAQQQAGGGRARGRATAPAARAFERARPTTRSSTPRSSTSPGTAAS